MVREDIRTHVHDDVAVHVVHASVHAGVNCVSRKLHHFVSIYIAGRKEIDCITLWLLL